MVKHILLVDDSVTARSQLRDVLKEEGYVVHEAENGYMALEIFKKESIDLVLTDLHMPILNGVGLLTSIRRLAENANVPVFVITADAEKTVKVQLRSLKIKAWVHKPHNNTNLLKGIKQILGHEPT